MHIAGHSFLDRGPAQAASQLIKAIHARGGWVSLDVGMEPSKAIPQKILQITRSVDILLVSLDEAAALTGTRDPFEAFAALRRAGAREVVLKVGRRGCIDQRKRQADASSILLGARGGFHRSRRRFRRRISASPLARLARDRRRRRRQTPPARWQPRSSVPAKICRDSAKSRRCCTHSD